jgi:hypothetical protein
MNGAIQLEYRGGANDEFIASRQCAAAIADDSSLPLVKLQPSPFRSLGGYFSYEGWPDQRRFMELDEALRRKACENPRYR